LYVDYQKNFKSLIQNLNNDMEGIRFDSTFFVIKDYFRVKE